MQNPAQEPSFRNAGFIRLKPALSKLRLPDESGVPIILRFRGARRGTSSGSSLSGRVRLLPKPDSPRARMGSAGAAPFRTECGGWLHYPVIDLYEPPSTAPAVKAAFNRTRLDLPAPNLA